MGICLGLFLVVLIYLLVKKRSHLKYFLFGICGFTISQVILRIPLLTMVQGTVAFQEFNLIYPFLVIFLLCFTAGLFEEPARFLFLRTTSKKDADLQIPLFYGLGHGGIEAALFVGVNNLIMLCTQQSLLIALDWTVFLAGLERISAIMIHLGLSYIVYYGIMKSNKLYLLLAILLHTCVNMGIMLLQFGVSELVYELLLCVVALVLIVCVRFLTQKGLRL